MSHGRGPSHPERDDRLDPGGQAEAPQAQSERFVPDPVEHEAAEKSASPAADDPQARNGTANQAPQGEIVVGVDGSDAAQAALHWALRYRGLTGGPIHAVAVWQHPPPVGDAPPMSSDEDLEQETDRLLSRRQKGHETGGAGQRARPGLPRRARKGWGPEASSAGLSEPADLRVGHHTSRSWLYAPPAETRPGAAQPSSHQPHQGAAARLRSLHRVRASATAARADTPVSSSMWLPGTSTLRAAGSMLARAGTTRSAAL